MSIVNFAWKTSTFLERESPQWRAISKQRSIGAVLTWCESQLLLALFWLLSVQTDNVWVQKRSWKHATSSCINRIEYHWHAVKKLEACSDMETIQCFLFTYSRNTTSPSPQLGLFLQHIWISMCTGLTWVNNQATSSSAWLFNGLLPKENSRHTTEDNVFLGRNSVQSAQKLNNKLPLFKQPEGL